MEIELLACMHLVNRIARRAGADAIVLHEGYDVDSGDFVIYTGDGGRDLSTGQKIDRGHRLQSPYAPQLGYRYDKLYFGESHWAEEDKIRAPN